MAVNQKHRLKFAAFLIELAAGHRDAEKWSALVVTHYHDERLEEIRAEVVRQDIAGSFDQDRLKELAAELRISQSTLTDP